VTGILLPPPSPALIVHEAASVIRQTVEAAQRHLDTAESWACYERATAWRDGFVNGMGGDCSELAALFTPELAFDFADWLDEVASANARHGVPLPPLAITAAHTVTRHPALEGATT